MGITERKIKDKEKIKEKILQAAIKLFVKDGFDNVSMRKLSEKIQYSPGTIYLHYKDKESILFELHTIAFQKFYAALSNALDERNPIKRLEQLGQNYLEFAWQNPEYYDLMFINNCVSASIAKEDEWIGMDSYGLLHQTINDCAEHGYISKHDVETATFSMWAFVHGIASLVIKKRISGIKEEELNHLIQGSLKFLINTLNIKNHKHKK
ncbi:MAG: TetR/AcrR family transcriptional regulator [Bacteroidetes bacterium]|nr:TetR/AcrR family transcriptional regulator [Bacteroidota bacterium]